MVNRFLIGMMILLLAIGGAGIHADAAEGGLLIAANPFAPKTYSFAEDGVVEKKWEFTIPAQPGENFDVEIVFTGNGGEGESLDIYYDLVTEDQMVPNEDKKATDRSGLLNETVTAGVEQRRVFEVAALDGDITIRAVGAGRIVSITVAKQMPKSAGEKVTVYTLGDSLVQTYSEKYKPQTGWGQTLPEYFDENVLFVNRALGGRSTGNYIRQGRLNEVLCDIAPGDYVLIEFGHNDASSGNGDRYVPVAKYKTNLSDIYIKGIRDRGATPILVTVCNKNDIARGTSDFIPSYPEYVEAMRQVADETDTLLVDLNAITVKKFTELNQKWGNGVCKGIVYNFALPGDYEGEYENGAADGTHLQRYGALLVSGYIAEELKNMNLKGFSEYYVQAKKADTVPEAPGGLREKEYAKYASGITWNPCENADFYQIWMAKVIESTADGSGAEYEVSGEYEVIGYTTAHSYAYAKATSEENYAYKVVAVNEAGVSEESEVFSFGLILKASDAAGQSVPEDAGTNAGVEITGGTQNGEGSAEEDTVGMMSVAWIVLGLFVLSVLGYVGLLVLISVISNKKNSKQK